MFHLEVSDCKTFKKFIEALKDILNEINLNIDSKGKVWFQVKYNFIKLHIIFYFISRHWTRLT